MNWQLKGGRGRGGGTSENRSFIGHSIGKSNQDYNMINLGSRLGPNRSIFQ